MCVCLCGKPLITPCRAAPEYLPWIFISSLTGALPWQTTWAAQILSALAWAQVALASDYNRMVVMRALHKAVDVDWPLFGWGYGPAPFWLGIWTGPFPVGVKALPVFSNISTVLYKKFAGLTHTQILPPEKVAHRASF